MTAYAHLGFDSSRHCCLEVLARALVCILVQYFVFNFMLMLIPLPDSLTSLRNHLTSTLCLVEFNSFSLVEGGGGYLCTLADPKTFERQMRPHHQDCMFLSAIVSH